MRVKIPFRGAPAAPLDPALVAPMSSPARPELTGGRRIGVLVQHGFTGNPQSMRPLAQAFAAAGCTVSLPLLPGHGTRVDIRMVHELCTRDPDPVPDARPAPAEGLAVLVAEDDPINRKVVTRMLDRLGIVPTVVVNGQEAVDAVRSASYDVVLMDVRMPVMDGIEATRLVTAVEDPPRVLVLTTFDLDEVVYDALRAGASGFQGVTLHADLDGNGSIDASVTWSNMTRGQLPIPTEHAGLLWFHP